VYIQTGGQAPNYMVDENLPTANLPDSNIIENILLRNYEVRIKDWVSEAFNIYKQHWRYYIPVAIILAGLIAASSVVSLNRSSKSDFLYAFLYFLSFLFPFLQALLIAGVSYTTLQLVSEDPLTSEIQIAHFLQVLKPKWALSIVFLNVIITLVVFFGLCLLIFPGVWMAVSLMFSVLFFLEYNETIPNLNIGQCMMTSYQVVRKNWCQWFLFLLVNGLLWIFIVTIPLSIISMVLAFRDAFGLKRGGFQLV